MLPISKSPPADGIAKMTTREIAQLTGKEHFHVMRDTQNMFNELQIDGLECDRNHQEGPLS